MVEWFGRPEIETDEVRERRITMEAVVDAYNEQERAIGWYYYLERRLDFPFLARYATRRSTSPLKVGDEVEVIGIADRSFKPQLYARSRIPYSLLIDHDDPFAVADMIKDLGLQTSVCAAMSPDVSVIGRTPAAA